MTQRKWISCAAIVAIALTAACSDSTTQPGDNLTTEQLQSMSTALTFLLGVSLGHPEASVASPAHFEARRVMAESVPIGGSTACPQGGRVGVNGTFSIDTAGATFALTDTLVACAIKDDHSNVWTFTSQPTLAVTIDEIANGGADSLDVSHFTTTQTDVGTVRYSTGDLSGTCLLDVSIEHDVAFGTPTADSSTLSLHTTGTVCGRAVTRDTSYTVFVPPAP